VGAILLQDGGSEEDKEENTTKKPKLHPLAYYSATFTPTERNYDIYERELLAVIKPSHTGDTTSSGPRNLSPSKPTMQTSYTGNPHENSMGVQPDGTASSRTMNTK
jgi:RNase H-like domain found in reverse transcriptase